MSRKVLAVFATAFMLCAPTTTAIAAAWLVHGEIDVVEGAPFSIGDSFSFVMHFDPGTPVSNPAACGSGGVGTICRHNGDPTMYFSSIVIDGIAYPNFGPAPPAGNSIIVRNNVPFGVDPAVDGYSFGSGELYNGGASITNFLLLFRGAGDLNVVTDGRILPASPPNGLLSLGQHAFQYCDGAADASGAIVNCDNTFVEGNITSVTAIPEPGALALVGLGLAGLGLGRRRKSH